MFEKEINRGSYLFIFLQKEKQHLIVCEKYVQYWKKKKKIFIKYIYYDKIGKIFIQRKIMSIWRYHHRWGGGG